MSIWELEVNYPLLTIDGDVEYQREVLELTRAPSLDTIRRLKARYGKFADDNNPVRVSEPERVIITESKPKGAWECLMTQMFPFDDTEVMAHDHV